MRTSLLLVLALTACITPSSDSASGSPTTGQTSIDDLSINDLRSRSVANSNLEEDGTAIHGYDPVAYFEEGGGKPTRGNKKFALWHEGIRYQFASMEHLDLFRENPSRYEPLYGGWCAYAMVNGEKVEIDADSFIVTDEGLFLFYDSFFADTRRKWLKKGHTNMKPPADAKWNELLVR